MTKQTEIFLSGITFDVVYNYDPKEERTNYTPEYNANIELCEITLNGNDLTELLDHHHETIEELIYQQHCD